jgi:hypothetical protein
VQDEAPVGGAVITLSVRGGWHATLERKTRKTLTKNQEAAIPFDAEAWADHLLAEEERQHRAPCLPYIRLFCGEFCEKVRIATSSGRIYEKGLAKHYSESESDQMRQDAREWLFSSDCEALWILLQEAGAYLWPYSRFRVKLTAAIQAGERLGWQRQGRAA